MTAADPALPRAPGQLASHYAPTARVRLDATTVGPGEALLNFGPDLRKGERVLNLSETGDLAEAAANLLAYLRAPHRPGIETNAVAHIPDLGPRAALNAPHRRAAAPG